MAHSRTVKTIILSAGQLIATLAMGIVMVVLARVLSVRDYGTYMQAMLVYSTALPFMTLGLPQAPFYFLPLNKNRARASVYENLLLLTFMGCIFSIGLFAGGNTLIAKLFGNPDLEKALLIIAPYPVFMLPILSLPAVLVARGRVVPVPIFSVVSKTTMLVLVLGACLIWGTLWSALFALVASAIVVFMPGLILILQSCPSEIRRPSWEGAREQLKYSIPLGAAGLIAILSLKLNHFVVSSICTPEEFAIYVNGAFEIPIVAVIMTSVRSVLLSEFVKMNAEGATEKIRELWSRSIVNASSVLIPVMVFCEVLAPEAMRLLFSAKYEAAAIPFRILLLLLIMRGISLNSVFLSTGNNKLILQRGIVSLTLNVVVTLFLVRSFGYVGASIGLVIVMYFWSTPFSIIKTAKILHSSAGKVYPFKQVGQILLVSLLAAMVLVLKLKVPGWSDLLVIGLSAVLYFPLVYFLYQGFKIEDIPNGNTFLDGVPAAHHFRMLNHGLAESTCISG